LPLIQLEEAEASSPEHYVYALTESYTSDSDREGRDFVMHSVFSTLEVAKKAAEDHAANTIEQHVERGYEDSDGDS
jgi:hypothetical protein